MMLVMYIYMIGGSWSIDDDNESDLYADYVGGDDFG